MSYMLRWIPANSRTKCMFVFVLKNSNWQDHILLNNNEKFYNWWLIIISYMIIRSLAQTLNQKQFNYGYWWEIQKCDKWKLLEYESNFSIYIYIYIYSKGNP